MIVGLCDTPHRLAARLYRAVAVDCPCCSFMRALALGLVVGLFAGAALALILKG